ncbi:MAG: stage II sporulation protein D [Bacillota bacterium]
MYTKRKIILPLILLIIVVPAVIVRGIFFFSGDGETETIRVYDHKSEEVEAMELNEYLLGVVAAEMPAAYHMEALKAQAVATRTYTVRKLTREQEEHPEADVCTDVNHCQAYLSPAELRVRWGVLNYYYNRKRIYSALEATRGEILVYQGEPVEALYHSNSGGRTENAVHVWGTDVSYLQSVNSPYDSDREDNYRQKVTYSLSRLEDRLEVEIGDQFYTSLQRSDSDRVLELEIGGKKFTGREIRELLGLPSTRFTVERKGNQVVFQVLGKGHGVGMSQDGADGLARRGRNYREILAHYYRETDIVGW